MKAIKQYSKKSHRYGVWLAALLLVGVYLVLGAVAFTVKPETKAGPVLNSRLPVVRFSAAAGFYPKAFLLTLSNAMRGARIYYTTDGTTPNEESAAYTAPILIRNRESEPNGISDLPTSPTWRHPLDNVFKGTLVKAIVVVNGQQSPVNSSTYFIHPKGRSRYSLPVVTLTIDPDDFFGYKRGIYVMGATRDDKDYYIRHQLNDLDALNAHRRPANYIQRGIDWERPVTVSYYEAGSNRGFSQAAGVRVHGNTSRVQSQRSLRVVFSEAYGSPELTYNLFDKSRQVPLSSILLKTFGQDQNRALFRDNLMQSLLEGSDLQVNRQGYQPAVLFINGEYWGLCSIEERTDMETIARKYRLPADSLGVINGWGGVYRGTSHDSVDYARLVSYMKTHDLAVPQHYSYVAQRMDLKNLTDYLVANMCAANMDWPVYNFFAWRHRSGKQQDTASPGDGRWRWLVVDLEMAFRYENRSVSIMARVLKSRTFKVMLPALLRNSGFRERFFSRFEAQLATTFAPEQAAAKISRLEALYSPEVAEHIRRWQTLSSVNAWEQEVEGMHKFVRERPAHQRQELEKLERSLENQQPFSSANR